MARYSYEAIDYSGEPIRGEMEASAPEAVIEHLQRQGLVPLSTKIQPHSKVVWLERLHVAPQEKLSLSDVASFTRDLSTMLQAGLSLDRSLDTLILSSRKPRVTAFLRRVQNRLRTGDGFAEALSSQNNAVPRVYIEMVRAGELGGADALRSTLDQLARYLGKTQKMRETIVSAMIYPIILMFVAVLSIILMLIFVLPQFEPLFQSAGDAVPVSTRFIMSVGNNLRSHGLAGLIVFIVVIACGRRILVSHPAYRLQWDEFKIRMPHVGLIIAKSETANFCRTLGALLSTGVSVTTALPIVTETSGNLIFTQTLERICAKVREGESLSALLSGEQHFPLLARQLVNIGEETGQMNVMLLKIADIYDDEVSRSIERLMALLTPAITIVLGVVIATIIASILSAILSVNDLVT
jgi:general secretion pathway protein F